MNMEKKEFLRNESVYVRSSAAGNPNADEPIKYKFIYQNIRSNKRDQSYMV